MRRNELHRLQREISHPALVYISTFFVGDKSLSFNLVFFLVGAHCLSGLTAQIAWMNIQIWYWQVVLLMQGHLFLFFSLFLRVARASSSRPKFQYYQKRFRYEERSDVVKCIFNLNRKNKYFLCKFIFHPEIMAFVLAEDRFSKKKVSVDFVATRCCSMSHWQ